MKNFQTAIVESIEYHMSGQLALSLKGFPYVMFVYPKELHSGGKNCEVSELRIGSKINYENITVTRNLENVTIMSDGIREVDEEGNLIKW